MSAYVDKINFALKLIDKNLSKQLVWIDISKECGISNFHFHRIFTAHMNETPGEYITRKRLERAMSFLAYANNTSLSEIAFSCGYSSQANFSKAFKKFFGVTPGQVIKGDRLKSNLGKLESRYGKEFKIQNLYPRKEINSDLYIKEVKMNHNIKEFPKRKVLFLSSKNGYARDSIYNTWKEISEIINNSGKNIDDINKFGVGHDNPEVTPEDKCRYDACVEVSESDNLPSGLGVNYFPKGKYACFHFKGSSEKLLQFYLDIYKNWFSANGYEPGNFPLIERYIKVDKENLDADIELETQFLLK
ncbi:MAG: AraC family transcriptional regulator [Halobacteriovoraceae bacterium]|nr:AraC family transcriptional regulator [Halobacteriovoraceae bacterium]